MRQLINGLLEYARADHLDEATPVSDGEEVLGQVLSNLKQLVEESSAAITHDTLPSVPIKAVHLEQLLQNLIGNALKYKRDGEPARVHVSASQRDREWDFSITDNGLGIEKQYQGKVFDLFKRLHSARGEHAGAGMGLAICQRIVERYGGRIWVDSDVDRGATFHFTIPTLAVKQ